MKFLDNENSMYCFDVAVKAFVDWEALKKNVDFNRELLRLSFGINVEKYHINEAFPYNGICSYALCTNDDEGAEYVWVVYNADEPRLSIGEGGDVLDVVGVKILLENTSEIQAISDSRVYVDLLYELQLKPKNPIIDKVIDYVKKMVDGDEE